MRISDWSSDVCSSDLAEAHLGAARQALATAEANFSSAAQTVHSFDLLRKERGLTEEDTPEQLGLRSEQHRESLDLAQRDLRILETVRLNAELEQAKQEESPANERSEERRDGKECVNKCRSCWSPYH